MSIFGFGRGNAQEQNLDFSQGWKTATEYFIKHKSAALGVSVDTLTVSDEKDVIGKNWAFYDIKSNNISTKHFKIEKSLETAALNSSPNSPISDKYNSLKAGIDRINSELLGNIAHEVRHKQNAEINTFGLNFQEIIDFAFWDEVSARIAELLLRRQAYTQTGSIQEAFTGVIFERKTQHPLTGEISDDHSYKNKMFQIYSNYLKTRKIKSEISIDEAKKLLECACVGLTEDKQDSELYAKTIPAISEYRLFFNHQTYLLHFNGTPALNEPTDWNQIMTQLFEFDGLNIWQMCGASEFNRQAKRFNRITKEEIYVTKMTKLGVSYQNSIDNFVTRVRSEKSF